jgi:hypothetical protein
MQKCVGDLFLLRHRLQLGGRRNARVAHEKILQCREFPQRLGNGHSDQQEQKISSNAHCTSIQCRPIRIFGTTPARGGNQ